MYDMSQKCVHCVGFAGAGKTALVDALERNFPGQVLSASRNFERSGRWRRLRARLLALRYIPRTFGIVGASRPINLRAFRKLMRLFHDHYRKLECAGFVPVPIVVFDEGIPHKLRAVRSMSTMEPMFSDLSEDHQALLADRIDFVIVLKPPFEVWRARCIKRGLEVRGRSEDATRYEDSMEKTLSDVRALHIANPGMFWMVTESTGDIDAEARRIVRELMAAFD